MGRIRVVFVLLAVLLLAPMALLVQRALESVAREREIDHRAVAERLFDEMERELSRVLQVEEERPFDAYGSAVRVGADAAKRSKSRAVLPGGASSYAIGYFQIDPDGTFRTPHASAAPARQERRAGAAVGGDGDGTPAPRAQAPAASALEAAVAQGLRSDDASERAPNAGAVPEPPPGATVALKDAKAWARDEGGPSDAAAEPEGSEEVSLYGALQSLNKAAGDRRERQRALAVQPRPAAPSAAAEIASAAPAAERLPALPEAESDALTRELGRAGKSEVGGTAPPLAAGRGPAPPRLEVYPMIGRLIDAQRLLLYRTVLFGGEVYRQGLVVDVPALFRRLDAAALGEGRLAAYVDREFFTIGAEPPASRDTGGFRFLHRFAEPFDALAVRLVLAPLPDVGGAGYLYAIAGLLLVSGSLGLVALYRMVAVKVRFAERRNNFVAAVSHELKTPLTAIRMYAELLRDGMVDGEEKKREYYGTITAESERLTRLINNVLEFSRLEQGTRDVSLVVGSLAPVVLEAAELLRPHAREAGFEIEVAAEEDLPPVRFDRDAVLQVVFNLVDNALKYSRSAADRRITVRCGRVGQGVAVAVRDRGPGVASQHLAKIFDAFYRGEDELTRTAKGTGIGLALVRGLADRMGAGVSGRNLREGGFEVTLTFRPAAVG